MFSVTILGSSEGQHSGFEGTSEKEMLQELLHPPEQLQIDEISSPLTAQIFELCDPELFPETLQNSEVTSCSNYCYEDNTKFNYSFQQDNNGSTTSTTTTTTTAATTANNSNSNSNSSFSNIIFDSQDDQIDNDISDSIDFSPFLSTQLPADHVTDFFSLQPQIQLPDVAVFDGMTSQCPPMGPPLSSLFFEEDCLSSVPSSSYNFPMNPPASPSCSFLGPAAMGSYVASAGSLNMALSAENSGIFGGGILMGSEIPQAQELDYQGDNNGVFCPGSLQLVFNAGDLQALSPKENSTALETEMSGLEDSAFKVGKLSVEQRKEKIHRYLKKRNERNFSKKIKYACRKTLADSRPRVRGRFAKNDDFGETHRPACGHHEEDEDDDVAAKEENDIVDSSDIFAHISGVNSFKCNYPVQSWI